MSGAEKIIHRLAAPTAAKYPGPPTNTKAESPAAVPPMPASTGPTVRDAVKNARADVVWRQPQIEKATRAVASRSQRITGRLDPRER